MPLFAAGLSYYRPHARLPTTLRQPIEPTVSPEPTYAEWRFEIIFKRKMI
jgi:hypothetical protein